MNILVIGNPTAGRGKAFPMMMRFVESLRRKGHCVKTFLTREKGDAARKASEIDPAATRLVVAGGDGTLNEVINGLPDPSVVPILPLPTGTANMLATDLGLPVRPEALADLVINGEILWLDLGIARGRRFLSIVSAGFDADVTRVLHQTRGEKLGYSGYARPILRAVARYRPSELLVRPDDGDPIPCAGAMILKTRKYGGYFVFAQDAARDSGCFHVVLFKRGSIPSLLRYALGGLLQRAEALGDVTRIAARSVRIESVEPAAVEIDGDYFGTTPVTATIQPGILPVIVP